MQTLYLAFKALWSLDLRCLQLNFPCPYPLFWSKQIIYRGLEMTSFTIMSSTSILVFHRVLLSHVLINFTHQSQAWTVKKLPLPPHLPCKHTCTTNTPARSDFSFLWTPKQPCDTVSWLVSWMGISQARKWEGPLFHLLLKLQDLCLPVL